MRQLVFVLCASAFGANLPNVDWDKIHHETLDHYTHLLRIDTSNPPGNETKAVDYLRSVLDREGIPYQVFALEPGRANLVARIKGNGSKRPIIVMGHTDVVGVQRDRWSVDPFGAIEKNGYIYGRGATDDRDNLTGSLMTVIILKRAGIPLDRDVIFVAEAGEEGTSEVGIDFLVNKHWDALEAEYALAEGGTAAELLVEAVHVLVGKGAHVEGGFALGRNDVAPEPDFDNCRNDGRPENRVAVLIVLQQIALDLGGARGIGDVVIAVGVLG